MSMLHSHNTASKLPNWIEPLFDTTFILVKVEILDTSLQVNFPSMTVRVDFDLSYINY